MIVVLEESASAKESGTNRETQALPNPKEPSKSTCNISLNVALPVLDMKNRVEERVG
jgi:hypothetical protein